MIKPDHDLDEFFSDIAKANQNWFNNLVEANGIKDTSTPGSVFVDMYKHFFDNTTAYLHTQQSFYQEQIKLWQNFFNKERQHVNTETVKPIDKRFSDPDWENNPFFSYLKQSYLNFSDYLVDFITNVDMDEETRLRLKFFMRQYLDAIAPSNFALTNPEVIKSVVETGGASLVDGMKNMVEDAKNGYIAMTDESKFAVGTNLAVTKGKVVFRNELIELIQYSPLTGTVYEVPLLIIPPCINKYYILDLQQSNSLVKYLVEQGYTVFLISWKSADKSIRNYKWSDYVDNGTIKAIEVIREISGKDKINTLGYCIGGIILTTSYLVLKARKLNWINVMAHMTTMLDHKEPGDIKYFLDRDLMALEEVKRKGGIMPGRIISQTFSALRANELIWNYWVNNYLLGKTPQPFDILYWNNDAVDLPVLMHAFLLKHLYLNNDLIKGDLLVGEIPINLNKITCPMYLFAAQKDHIVPWVSAYKTTTYVKKNVRFVLGASGHTAGVVNPVSSDKRNYWINDKLVKDPDEWFRNATEMSGSWWKDLNKWLSGFSGKHVKAKKTLGNKEFKPIMDAPGEYVKAKAMPIIEAELS